MDNSIQEKFIEKSPIPITIENTEKILNQMKKNVCKIIKRDGKRGTGFFCRIPFPDKNNIIHALVTNNHVLNEKDIQNGNSIEFTLNDDRETKIIVIDYKRKKYTNKNLDITFIEIDVMKDNIYDFLDVNEDIANNNILINSYINSSLYVLHYAKGKKIKVSYGLLNKICDYHILHFCSTDFGSSGSPILSLETFRVIGIHKSAPKNDNEQFNNGTLLSKAIIRFYEHYNIKNNNNNKHIDNVKSFKYEVKRAHGPFITYSNLKPNIPDKRNNRPSIDASNLISKMNAKRAHTPLNTYSNLKSNISDEKNKKITVTERTVRKKNFLIKNVTVTRFKDIKKLNTLTLKYRKNKSKEIIQIFGTSFFENNKKNCKLIINQEEQELTDILNVSEFKEDEIEIKLKEIKKITNMSYMFYKCEELISFSEISNWDTSEVTNMSFMFSYLPLKSLPNISKWDTSKVINMCHMFSHSSLESLPDISKWNTSKVTDISYMFFNCKLLSKFPNIFHWNLKNVMEKKNMFSGCKNLKDIPDYFQN